MGFNIGKIASVASSIAGKADIASSLSGIDLSSINPMNMDSVKSTIESVINSKISSITSELQSSINVGDLESAVGEFNIAGQANEIQSSLTSNMDVSSLEGLSDGMMNDIQSQVDSMMGGMNLSNINFM